MHDFSTNNAFEYFLIVALNLSSLSHFTIRKILQKSNVKMI